MCTAGILLPLHLTIGIRLDKEDELRGLDMTGKIIILLNEIRNLSLVYYSSW